MHPILIDDKIKALVKNVNVVDEAAKLFIKYWWQISTLSIGQFSLSGL
jgi:hypothetical protein